MTINHTVTTSAELKRVPVGQHGTDRDGYAVVRDEYGVQLFVPEQAAWAPISFAELDGEFSEDGVSRFFPIEFGGLPARL